MNTTRGAILILTHSRANLLRELFQNLENLIGFQSVPLIVVRQVGFNEVKEVVDGWRKNINVYVEMDGSAKSAAENIARNRFAGYSVGFNSLFVDWILAIEDDVILANDSLKFAQFIMDKYFKKRKFRAINLGSRLVQSGIGMSSYSMTRFGLFGPASVMPRSTWNKLQKFGVIRNSLNEHWDSTVESFLKTGLTIAPNNSRYIDRGWLGTHTKSKDEETYFFDLERSFVGVAYAGDDEYFRAEIGYYWREDLRKYKNFESLVYWVAFLIKHPLIIKMYQKNFKHYLLKFKRR